MPFKSLIEEVTPHLLKLWFAPLDDGGGMRYDSWEWNWIRPTEDGVQFITLSALEIQPGLYDMEVWFDGSEQGHADRMPLLQFHAIHEFNPVTDDIRPLVILTALIIAPEMFKMYSRGGQLLPRQNTPRCAAS